MAEAESDVVETAVTRPFASTVITGICELDPNDPTFEFVVAKVAANEPIPDPVRSPVKVIV